ncbi:MAG TPA: amino acid racemase [bacterium]|nr:amino acid racemase [bacterium]
MHKTIGILGGMTPESTTIYYQHITRTYVRRFGDYRFPPVVIYSVSFQQYEDWMTSGQWESIACGLSEGLLALHRAGADFAVLATNTMHNVLPELLKSAPIPILSIIDATAEAVQSRGMDTVGLLGTRFTMEKPFYVERLKHYGIKTLIPNNKDRETIHRIIFEELGSGIFTDESRYLYVSIVHRLRDAGARGVILGCTEIPLLIGESDCGVPLFDTAVIHADKALEYAIH